MNFNFQARVFQAPGAHFELITQGAGRPKEAMFGVNMGNGQAVISLKHLRENFGIVPGSHDDQLVERAEQGLKYVPDIRPGDAIPRELLDGTASWTVGKKHKRIARERIQGLLLAWITGTEIDVTDRAALAKIMEAPETKTQLRDGFKRAASELGLGDDTDQVLDRIETLARELCYIEALRDRVRQVSRIRELIVKLIKVYNNDQRAVDEMNRCKVLMKEGWHEISMPPATLDKQIADVMNALQTIDKAIAAVRKTRDENSLHPDGLGPRDLEVGTPRARARPGGGTRAARAVSFPRQPFLQRQEHDVGVASRLEHFQAKW